MENYDETRRLYRMNYSAVEVSVQRHQEFVIHES